MNRRRLFGIIVSLAVLAVAALCYWLEASPEDEPHDYANVDRLPAIEPDYTGCTLPPNIAPLNFVVKEPGEEYRVAVSSDRGERFVVSSRSGGVVIPIDKWKLLLELNRGKELFFDIYAKDAKGSWRRFKTIENSIALEGVDSHLVYRRIKPVHTIYTNMGTYQRDVTSYRESPVLLSDLKSKRCVNCHTFVNNRPETMSLHVRGPGAVAMILAKGDKAEKINTRTSFNSRPASYTAWHPSGLVAAFAAIDVIQFHHSTGNSRGVLDRSSDVCLYTVNSNTVSANAEIAHPERLETFPTWSPDGKYLYFCSAEKTWADRSGVPPEYKKFRYDLVRVSYDLKTGQCGERQMVLSSADTGLSINEPRISPDGRFLLFCMAQHGSFPVFMKSSDLYMMDIETRRYWRLSVNSDASDSWHCWSTNGRWIAFASKRIDGLLGRVYFSYIDPDGKARKPILLPQRDPEFYNSFIENFNAPELITKPVSIDPRVLAGVVRSRDQKEADFTPMREVSGWTTGVDKNPTTRPAQASGVKSNLKEARRYHDLARSMLAKGDTARAIEQYKLSIASLAPSHAANVPALKELAWIRATHPHEEFRNGKEAISLISRAISLATLQIKLARNERARKYARAAMPQLQDVFAAASAETGGFLDAVNIALRAEKIALDEGQIELAIAIRTRVELYLVEKPYRSTRLE